MSAQPVETVEVSTASVACDGGPGALGHPKVYLNLAKDGQIDCPYCGKRFVLKAGNSDAHGSRLTNASGQRQLATAAAKRGRV